MPIKFYLNINDFLDILIPNENGDYAECIRKQFEPGLKEFNRLIFTKKNHHFSGEK
jgi:hypothetical protein